MPVACYNQLGCRGSAAATGSSPCWHSPPAPAGKERLFLEAARVLQRRIYVSVAKRKVGRVEQGVRRSAAGVAAVARRRRGRVEEGLLTYPPLQA